MTAYAMHPADAGTDSVVPSARELSDRIAQLARAASIEINVQDVKHLDASCELLPQDTKVYVSHLPHQSWEQTQQVCRAVRAAGFRPVAHLPVRPLTDQRTLEQVLDGLVRVADVKEVLLIAGDYPHASGPYAAAVDVLRTGLLQRYGVHSVSMAGHPEGHQKVPLEEIRRAELEKVAMARDAGLAPTLVTQFFFEHGPFIEWLAGLRAAGVSSPIVAGLAGPARLSTLLKFAMRCGVGASVRALRARPSSVLRIVADHGPERLLHELAQAQGADHASFDGIHLFCFGGFLRTCAWLHSIASGHFRLEPADGFSVDSVDVAAGHRAE